MINWKVTPLVGCGQTCPATPSFSKFPEVSLDDLRSAVRWKNCLEIESFIHSTQKPKLYHQNVLDQSDCRIL